MKSLDDFNFELPKHLIAQEPLASRSSSKLMCLDRKTGKIDHLVFTNIIELIKSNDLMVFNSSKVIPARLRACKNTGGVLEVFVERILNNNRVRAQIKSRSRLAVGDKLFLTNEIFFELSNRQGSLFELTLCSSLSLEDILEKFGHTPLPPYIKREATLDDKDRYQTIYAQHPGSVAAPTAGLHFDQQLMTKLEEKDIDKTFIVLHVGLGTFKPVCTNNLTEHQLHEEYIEVSSGVCTAIRNTKKRGGRVISVGTTTLRALESAGLSGEVAPYYGDTKIFIYGEYDFVSTDVLITNFHLPKSTLLMLVCAFGGYENIMQAYKEAIKNNYRFYSYGDAMIII